MEPGAPETYEGGGERKKPKYRTFQSTNPEKQLLRLSQNKRKEYSF